MTIKTIFISILGTVLFSNAWAASECPQIAGAYQCAYREWVETYELAIGQKVNAVDEFIFANLSKNMKNQYIADGLNYNFIDNGFDVILRTSCSSQTLITQEKASEIGNNFQVYKKTFVTAPSPDQLEIQVDYKSVFYDESHSSGTFHVDCLRTN